MGRAGVLQGVRQMRFEALLDRHERGELSQIEAAEMLGITERTFRRWRGRLRDEGPVGLRDRRIGKPSSRGPSAHGLDPWGAAVEEILRMLGLYREVYADFTVKHFHERGGVPSPASRRSGSPRCYQLSRGIGPEFVLACCNALAHRNPAARRGA